jgi:hypothetical protein
MSAEPKTRRQKSADMFGAFLFVLLLPIVLPIVLIALTFHLLAGLFLHVAVWFCWCARGKYVLLVYSDSPVWEEYVEREIIPRLGDRAVVLNWSARKRWRSSLAVLAFRYFGGWTDFNPLAVVFRPLRLARSFRFYQPFREFKHGKPEAVEKLKQELFEVVDTVTRSRAA